MSPDRMMPVIMLTANSEVEYVMESRDKGVTEFLAKPFTADSMYRRLVSVIARPRDFVSVKCYFDPDSRRHKLPFEGPDRSNHKSERRTGRRVVGEPWTRGV